MIQSKCLLTLLLLLFAVSARSQGIQFQQLQSWDEVIAKAKAEHKKIFVDCYTTWCTPCKLMEKEIYPLESVGAYYNQNFISIKIQMDKLSKDDSVTKKWYFVADNFQTTYAVNAYPTYLFFDTDGKPLHKVVGGQSATSFIQMAKDALMPEKQYYNIIKNYVPGKLDTAELKGLAGLFQWDNKELAGKIVKDYFDRISKKEWTRRDNLEFLRLLNSTKEAGVVTSYILLKQKLSTKERHSLFDAFQNDSLVQSVAFGQLKNLSKHRVAKTETLQLLTIFKNQQKFKEIANKYISSLTIKEWLLKSNISLMRAFMSSSNDKAFYIFLNHSEQVDSVMKAPQYAEIALTKIITKENVDPQIQKSKACSKKPDWNSIGRAIEIKYGKTYAERSIITAKPAFYKDVKCWNEYAKSLIRYVDTYISIVPKSAFYLNNMAYAVFENSNDLNDLKRAIYWIDVALKSDTGSRYYPTYMSTKAEIMYKIGMKQESIELMKKAIGMDEKKNPDGADWYKELELMKRGEKIWPEKVDGK